jgi:hypothetical protein
VIALLACGSDSDDDSTSTSSTTTTTTSSGPGGSGPACTEPGTVPCEDQVLLAMNLKDDVSAGAITNQADGSGWISAIDATAGGAFNPDPTSYTYGRFTDQGLVKVDISDEAGLASMEWDIAFRRYVARINSGHSGPSCVTSARVPGTATYDSITAVPDGLTFRTDEYFTESCELIPDGTGLEGSPATALSSFWEYPGCVQMTGNVYVIELADGRNLKLTVQSYYEPTIQQQCQSTGMVPMTDTGAANYLVRWAFLP